MTPLEHTAQALGMVRSAFVARPQETSRAEVLERLKKLGELADTLYELIADGRMDDLPESYKVVVDTLTAWTPYIPELEKATEWGAL